MKKYCGTMVAIMALGAGVVFGASELTFNTAGQPAALVVDEINRLTTDAGQGFYLREFTGVDYTSTYLSDVTTSGNTVTVSAPGGSPSFTFLIMPGERYLSIILQDAVGIDGLTSSYGLSLNLVFASAVSTKTFDDLIDVSGSTTVETQYATGFIQVEVNP